VWLDAAAQNYAFVMVLNPAIQNERADQAVECVSPTRFDYAVAAWDVMCERTDGISFALTVNASQHHT
jgi:hypothetical protein